MAGAAEPSDVGSSNLESEIGLRVDQSFGATCLIGSEVTYTPTTSRTPIAPTTASTSVRTSRI